MSLETSVAIIAICFAILFIILIILALKLYGTIKKIDQTLSSLDAQARPLIQDAAKTVTTAHEISSKIKANIEQTTPFFTSISKTGLLMEKALHGLRRDDEDSPKVISLREERADRITIDDWVEWIGLGLLLLRNIKKRMKK